jgi:hypothetical protein
MPEMRARKIPVPCRQPKNAKTNPVQGLAHMRSHSHLRPRASAIRCLAGQVMT